MMSRLRLALISATIFMYSCEGGKSPEIKKNNPETKEKKEEKQEAPALVINYHFEKKAIWNKKDTFEGNAHKNILAAINRVDLANLKRLDSILVPDKYIDSVSLYMPFPAYSDALKEVKKIIIFSYPTQAFAAYEYGKLVISGPTNMGKKASKTPTGLFFCNWKSKEIRSTVDNEWILKWNFNVSNLGGVGFHEYALPGYPASHSCMRLWSEQAQFLYTWAEQWKLNNEDKLVAKGTPVIVYGEYPFGKPRPWFVLAQNGQALAINEQAMQDIVKPYLESIIKEQQNRDELVNNITDSSKIVAVKDGNTK